MTNTIHAVITAYCICTKCCGPHATGLNAAGHKPVEGVSIAGPRAYKLGTRVEINHHVYVIDDRTAKRFDGRWDVYRASHKSALKWGKQELTVTILP